MSTWAGVPRNIARTAVFIPSFLSLASVASANPAAPSYVDPMALAFLNYPVNGVVLLVMFSLYTILNRSETPMGGFYHSLLVLMTTLIIAFTGGVIDLAVLEADTSMVYLVGLLTIASIGALMAHVALLMDIPWSILTGAVYFTLNAIAWSLLQWNDQDLALVQDPTTWWSVTLLFVLVTFAVCYRLFGHGTRMSFERRTSMSKEDRAILKAIGKMEGHISMVFLMVVLAFFFLLFAGSGL